MSIVRKGERGVDSAFSHPPVQKLLDEGFTFRVGYISVPPASPGKNITVQECQDTINAGMKLLLVWEMDAMRPNLGATYGAIDGRNAAIEAAKRGLPTDVPIISAADLNTLFSNIDRHEAYMRAFSANCAPYPHEIGEYADTDLLARTAGLWRIGWVPLGAWAWSGTSYANALAKAKAIGAHVVQSKGYYIDNIWAVDPNEAIADFPAWGPPEPQPPLEDDMQTQLLKIQGYAAQLLARVSDTGAAQRAEWTGPADEGGITNPRIEWFRAAFKPTALQPNFEMGPFTADLLNKIALDGELPPGMSPDLFANADEIRTRIASTAALAQLNDSVARIGQWVGDIQRGLEIAATAKPIV